ncbi:hypothetical Protein YC6258_02994 [Gynuella sunshinyii YC6258]|uniref:Uncharacterized protein n=1 Tax=Gynuella sunshinyii YC6258 TaxID=1445510 RepID=A0A0C5VK26_9GAMM|nr:hypothetical Protein YC6258_02994 [Gynuella sunshinyii YC6258]
MSENHIGNSSVLQVLQRATAVSKNPVGRMKWRFKRIFGFSPAIGICVFQVMK